MAPQKVEKSRKRKRKARTEVSSSSESSSESERSSSPRPAKTDDIDTNKSPQPSTRGSSEGHGSVASPEPQKQKPRDPEQAFEDFYLKQATIEFANDIDKLRSAPDFNEKNVPILIRALRQGTACFGEEERRKIGVAAGE